MLLYPLPALADYHYASHTGSNEYPYTSWATAADSIQKAIDAASPHDTVYVGSGEYHEQVTINRDSIALIGMGYDSTLVWYADNQLETITATPNMYWTIFVEGIHVQNRTNFWAFSGSTRNNLHLNRCRFSHPQDLTDGAGANSAAAPDYVLIENCIFDSIQVGFFDMLGSRNVVVKNNLFFFCWETPIFLDNHMGKILNNIIIHGYRYEPVFGECDTLIIKGNLLAEYSQGFSIGATIDSQIIENNTIDLKNDNTSNMAINGTGRWNRFNNNSISNVAQSISGVYNWQTMLYSYNNMWNVARQNIYVEPEGILDTTGGNLSVDPMFVGNGDYHLQAFSPLIDAGNPLILDTDGSRSDIGFYGGPGGQSYEYLDLPPRTPDSLRANIDSLPTFVALYWSRNHEADFNHYLLYRDTSSGFMPSPENLIAQPESSFYFDTGISIIRDYFYLVAAVDDQGNATYSGEYQLDLVGIDDDDNSARPIQTGISSNYPNPFNSQTTIVFSVADLGPIPAQIDINIYNVLGRKVRTLLSAKKEVGYYSIIWDGREDSGDVCASGVYFVRISQWSTDYMNKPRRITLIR
jgi:hypothetical protein